MTRDLVKKRAQERRRRLLKALLTKQRKPLPFESGYNVLPGLEHLAKHPEVLLVARRTARHNKRRKY